MEHIKDYTPAPLDVDGIELPEEINGLVELMARNVHEVWASGRIREGWTYGPERDDRLKTHPCLVPYEELPESEREYDRMTASQTLRFIIKLGFKIHK